MISDDDQIAISAIEHYAYCPRQASLIHVEGVWEANSHTASGCVAHAAVDRETRQVLRDGVQTWLSLPVWHDELGLYGVCDVVELRAGVPVPVEHKPRSTRRYGPAEQQLMAQGMCLESMWGLSIPHGVLLARRGNVRRSVSFDDHLREVTLATISALGTMIRDHGLPEPVADARCDECSLLNVCLVRVADAPEGDSDFESDR